MLKNTCCSICLSINKRTINIYGTDLQYVYENLANFKISDECWMCYICHTRLRQCHQLQQLAVQTRRLIDGIFQNKIDIMFGAFASLLELSTSKTMITSSYIKQESDGETEFHSDNGIEQDEILVNTIDYEVEEKPSIESEDPLAQELPNVLKNDTLQKSKAHKFKLVKLSQIVNVEYAPQNPTTSAVTEDLEGRRKQSWVEQSTYNAEIKQEIKKEIGDNGIEQDDKQDNTNDNEGRDHASEAQSGCYKKPLSCDVCLKNYTRKCQFLNHVRTHTGEEPYICDICSKEFSQKGTEQNEILVNTIDYEVEGKPSMESEDVLAQELPNVLKNDALQKSNARKIRLVKLSQIVNVEYSPQNPTTSAVTEDLEGRGKQSFGEQSTYNAEIKQMKEEIGDKGIDHYDVQDNTNDCEGRDRASEAQSGRYKKPHSCHVCLKKFSYKSKLLSHIRTHTGELPFSCDICSKKFSQSGDLYRHTRVIHNGDKPFSCDICSKKFARKAHVDRHMLTHTGDQPFSCDICSKKFAFKINLDTHIQIHNDKTYICYICGKKFAVKRYLKTHLLSHAGVKPFSCDICSKKFSRKIGLNNHKLIHKGEKPFSCDICSKKFTYKSNFNTHKQVHNKQKTIHTPAMFVERNS